jgi:hypothetical protein
LVLAFSIWSFFVFDFNGFGTRPLAGSKRLVPEKGNGLVR